MIDDAIRKAYLEGHCHGQVQEKFSNEFDPSFINEEGKMKASPKDLDVILDNAKRDWEFFAVCNPRNRENESQS